MSREPLRPVFTVRGFLEETVVELTLLDRAVLLILASFMDAEDGRNGRPGAARLAAITGAHPKSVMKALYRLRDLGLIEGAIEHPHRGTSQTWSLVRGAVALPFEVERGALERRKGSPGAPKGEPGYSPTDKTDIDRARGQSEITEDELLEIALERARSNGATSVRAYAAKIVVESRADLEAEVLRRREKARVEAAIAACDLCDDDGFRDVDETTRVRCNHQVEVRR